MQCFRTKRSDLVLGFISPITLSSDLHFFEFISANILLYEVKFNPIFMLSEVEVKLTSGFFGT